MQTAPEFEKFKKLKQLGKWSTANKVLAELVKTKPGAAEFENALREFVRQRLGHVPSANLAKSLAAIQSDFNRGGDAVLTRCAQELHNLRSQFGAIPAIVNLQAATAARTSQNSEAVTRYCELLRLLPGFVDGFINLGNVRQQEKNYKDAIATYYEGLAFAPNSPVLWANLGRCYAKIDNLEKVKVCFERSIDLRPAHIQTLNNYGVSLFELGSIDDAESVLKSAEALDMSNGDVNLNLANIYQVRGDLRKARRHYNNVFSGNSSWSESFYNLSLIKFSDENSDLLKRAEDTFQDQNTSVSDLIFLGFGLANYFDTVGRCDRAFFYYEAANTLSAKTFRYDIKEDQGFFTRLQQSFSAQYSKTDSILGNRWHSENRQDPRMVFILGMPRSGSTLLEQILTTSEQIGTGGEMPWVPRFGQQWCLSEKPVNRDNVLDFRSKYLQQVGQKSLGTPFVIDKLPGNFKYIALIAEAFPEAKIIHICRDARAVGWSIYRQRFSRDTHTYGYNFNTIRGYWSLYRSMMRFWHDSPYSSKIFNLSYERMVESPQEVLGEVVEFLGIPWSNSFLHPENNKSVVRTASSIQIRSPIFQGSSDAWKRYEDILPPSFFEIGQNLSSE